MCTGLLTSHSNGGSGGADGERAWTVVNDLGGSLVRRVLIKFQTTPTFFSLPLGICIRISQAKIQRILNENCKSATHFRKNTKENMTLRNFCSHFYPKGPSG